MTEITALPNLDTPAQVTDSLLVYNSSNPAGNRVAEINMSGVQTEVLKGDGTVGDLPATSVPFTPSGSIDATNVQAAIQEVRDEVIFFRPEHYGTARTDVEIQAAIDAAALVSGTVYLAAESYTCAATIFVPDNVSIFGEGEHSKLIPDVAASFTEGFMMRLNTTTGNSWDTAYSKIEKVITGLCFDNSSTSATANNGLKIGSKHKIENLIFISIHQALTWVTDYLDSKNFNGLHIIDSMATAVYAVEVQSGSLGDNLDFNRLSCSFEPTTTPLDRKVLRLYGCNGGTIRNSVINGEAFISRSNMTLDNIHAELHGDMSSLIFDTSAGIVLRDSWVEVGDNTGLVIQRTSGGLLNFGPVIIENVKFTHKGRSGVDLGTGADISLCDTYVAIKNSYHVFSTNGITRAFIMGLNILNGDTSVGIDDFNQRSFILSDSCCLRDTVVKDYNMTISGGSGSETSSVTMSTSSELDFTDPSDTYFYTIQYLYDVARMVGVQSEEESVAVTNAGNSPNLIAQTTSNHERAYVMRIYRGTSTGSYDKYVDIPSIYTYYHIDSGGDIFGFPWIARTAGGVDALNADLARRLLVSRDNVTVYASTPAAPPVGTWARGDRIEDATPSNGSPAAYICTAAGTPGTWALIS